MPGNLQRRKSIIVAIYFLVFLAGDFLTDFLAGAFLAATLTVVAFLALLGAVFRGAVRFAITGFLMVFLGATFATFLVAVAFLTGLRVAVFLGLLVAEMPAISEGGATWSDCATLARPVRWPGWTQALCGGEHGRLLRGPECIIAVDYAAAAARFRVSRGTGSKGRLIRKHGRHKPEVFDDLN